MVVMIYPLRSVISGLCRKTPSATHAERQPKRISLNLNIALLHDVETVPNLDFPRQGRAISYDGKNTSIGARVSRNVIVSRRKIRDPPRSGTNGIDVSEISGPWSRSGVEFFHVAEGPSHPEQ